MLQYVVATGMSGSFAEEQCRRVISESKIVRYDFTKIAKPRVGPHRREVEISALGNRQYKGAGCLTICVPRAEGRARGYTKHAAEA